MEHVESFRGDDARSAHRSVLSEVAPEVIEDVFKPCGLTVRFKVSCLSMLPENKSWLPAGRQLSRAAAGPALHGQEQRAAGGEARHAVARRLGAAEAGRDDGSGALRAAAARLVAALW